MAAIFDPRSTYSQAETAEILAISPRTLCNWRYAGRGPVYMKFGDGRSAPVLYAGRDIEDWLEAHRVERAPAAA